MKCSIQETDMYGPSWKIFIDLEPETPQEAAILLRLTARRKKTPPSIITSFCDDINTQISISMSIASNARETLIE